MAESGGEGAGSGEAPQDTTTTVPQQGLMDWRSTLPETLRTAGVIQQLPTMEGAAKTLVSQGEMLGRALFLPSEEPGTPEHARKMEAVYAKLGRPDTADAYTLPEIEGYALDEDSTKAFRVAAHAAGMTQAQAEQMLHFDAQRLKRIGNQLAAAEAQSEIKGRQALTAEFGAMTDEVLTQARGFFEHFGAGAFGGEAGKLAWQAILDAKLPDGSALRNSPHVIAAFAEAGKSLGEGNFLESDHYVPGQNTLNTLQSRQAALTAKKFSPEFTEKDQQELDAVFEELRKHRDRQAGTGGRTGAYSRG